MVANFWSDFSIWTPQMFEVAGTSNRRNADICEKSEILLFVLLKHLLCPGALQLQIPHWFTNRGTSQC